MNFIIKSQVGNTLLIVFTNDFYRNTSGGRLILFIFNASFFLNLNSIGVCSPNWTLIWPEPVKGEVGDAPLEPFPYLMKLILLTVRLQLLRNFFLLNNLHTRSF